MAVLNMASSSSPGGGFRFGAGAQDFWVPGAFLEVIEVVPQVLVLRDVVEVGSECSET